MNILITGAKGFIGQNLCATLKNIRDGKDKTRPNLKIDEIFEYDIETNNSLLDEYCVNADFVFNLAGVNRPHNTSEFMRGNFEFLSKLLSILKKHHNTCPVMNSSSIQADYDNDYGKSKRAGEDLLFAYSKETGVKVLIYRFQNLFGKWCRPNYNSVVSTFCNNIANDLPILIKNRQAILTLCYIDDVVDELLNSLEGKENINGRFCKVEPEYKVNLGEIADLIYKFADQPKTLVIPEIPENSFAKKLYSTYLSYLPKEKISFTLNMNFDDRGSFTELFKTSNSGQFSLNISKPGTTKGLHWHNTKWELFVVVSGKGLIQQRKIGTDQVLDFYVSGDKIEVVHMIPGYIHNLINLSKTENLVTVMWSNEHFNKDKPDTFYEVI